MIYILYTMFCLIILVPVIEYLIPGVKKSFNFLIYTITIKIVTLMLLPLGLNIPIEELLLSINPITITTPVIMTVVIIYHYKRFKQFTTKRSQIISGK
ncbi:hypothetical protein HYG86_13985 [Alkalicella caledoniensis]|uniref:Uncharacterized protein n=1 Tax=Alkalicella caledoniensis TaxID=2731377 RepID=A0A7G9WAT2_ALKCA|nr:hypothetical protein [Alkalicella caledoniensis]QNO15794.1 hypothetical protein HYG86_13985 [Alkalicella caledoniensis]